MLSLAAGLYCGLAKLITPILVRTPSYPVGSGFTPGDWINGLGLINDDLAGDSAATTAIVSMSTYWSRNVFTLNGVQSQFLSQGFEINAHRQLTSLVAKGAVLVTGTGNTDLNGSLSDGWPSNFARTNNPLNIPSLMSVAAVDSTGTIRYGLTDDTNGVPQFYAPGISVVVAEGLTTNWVGNPPDPASQFRTATGTSCCESPNPRVAIRLGLRRLQGTTANHVQRPQ